MTQHDTIRAADPAEWIRWIDGRASHSDSIRHARSRDRACYPEFPFEVWVEGYYPYVCHAGRWSWAEVGPEEGPCDNRLDEWPACPRVLAIPLDDSAHSHSGDWRKFFRGKTGYEAFYVEFLFRHKTDADRFRAAVPGLPFPEDP